MTAMMWPQGLGAYNASGRVGLRVTPLEATDLAAVERHLLALAPADRRARFLGDPSDAVIAAHARRLDPSGAIIIGAIDSSARVIGLAEAYPTDTQRTVEVAVSVDVAFRRRGVGRCLVARVLALAFARGAESAEFVSAPDNHALARLVQGLGGRTRGLGHFSIIRSADLRSGTQRENCRVVDGWRPEFRWQRPAQWAAGHGGARLLERSCTGRSGCAENRHYTERKKTEPKMSRSPAQAKIAQNSDRAVSKARSRVVLASIPVHGRKETLAAHWRLRVDRSTGISCSRSLPTSKSMGRPRLKRCVSNSLRPT
jgi:RimJ/RimL family protein N-acetyltransferase